MPCRVGLNVKILSSGSATLHLRLPRPDCQVILHCQQGKTGGDTLFVFFVFVFLSEVIIYVCMIFSGGADGGWSCGATHGPTNH